jgi:hypothetical protein
LINSITDRSAPGNGRLRSLASGDVVDRAGSKAKGVDLTGRGEVVHLVVQDDPVVRHYKIKTRSVSYRIRVEGAGLTGTASPVGVDSATNIADAGQPYYFNRAPRCARTHVVRETAIPSPSTTAK